MSRKFEDEPTSRNYREGRYMGKYKGKYCRGTTMHSHFYKRVALFWDRLRGVNPGVW